MWRKEISGKQYLYFREKAHLPTPSQPKSSTRSDALLRPSVETAAPSGRPCPAVPLPGRAEAGHRPSSPHPLRHDAALMPARCSPHRALLTPDGSRWPGLPRSSPRYSGPGSRSGLSILPPPPPPPPGFRPFPRRPTLPAPRPGVAPPLAPAGNAPSRRRGSGPKAAPRSRARPASTRGCERREWRDPEGRVCGGAGHPGPEEGSPS